MVKKAVVYGLPLLLLLILVVFGWMAYRRREGFANTYSNVRFDRRNTTQISDTVWAQLQSEVKKTTKYPKLKNISIEFIPSTTGTGYSVLKFRRNASSLVSGYDSKGKTAAEIASWMNSKLY